MELCSYQKRQLSILVEQDSGWLELTGDVVSYRTGLVVHQNARNVL